MTKTVYKHKRSFLSGNGLVRVVEYESEGCFFYNVYHRGSRHGFWRKQLTMVSESILTASGINLPKTGPTRTIVEP